jgi:hypothetical protein
MMRWTGTPRTSPSSGVNTVKAELQFWIDRWQKAPNGDLTICIDAKGLPTLLGVKPSYQFAKRADGSVYYP